MVSPKWAWTTVIAVLAVAVCFVVFRLGNQASAGVTLDDAVIWIEDGQRGELLQINGATREVTARVQVGERGDSIVAIPRDRDAVFLNRTTGELGVVGAVSLRVDFVEQLNPSTGTISGEQLELKADFDSSVNAYVIDNDQTLVVEPGAGIRLPIPTPDGLGSTVVRSDGELLAVTVDGRRVGVTSSQGIVDLLTLAEPIAGSTEVPQLVRADENVFIVDLARRTVNQLFEDGDLGTTTCLAGSLSDATVGGTFLKGESGTLRVLAHDASAAILSVSEPSRSDCYNIDLSDVPGEIYGAPVAVDGTAYLPNWETGRIVIVDLDERVVVTTVPFASQRGVPFELEVFNNSVWANEPQGPFAALVTRQGIEPIRKLGRVVIDNNIDGGEGGASVVVSEVDEGGGRAFGDSGDPVTGDDDTDSTDTGAGGGTGLDGTDPGGTPSDETGLTPDGDQPPVGVIVNETRGTITDGLLANFEFSADTVSVGEAVTFSDTTIGDPISWNWDFGDGTGDEGPEVVKIWDEEGIFTVQLFVADAAGNQGQQSKEITVVASDVLRAPVANFTFRSETIEVGESLEFTNTSTGEPDLIEWDFGDGVTAVGDVVEHQYASDGTFEVTLTATNDAGNDATSATITVVQGVTQPEAIISTFPTVLEVGQSILIRSESTNSPTSIEWDFGDGERAIGEEVRHSWERPGTYRIRLTVTNSAGSSSTFRDVIIKPRVNPPIARFGESTLEAIVGQPISFNDLSQNQPTQVTWEFGDGLSTSGSNVTHSWGREGTYTVTLTVQNEAGSDEVAKTVTILPLPPDPPTASFTLSSATVPVNAVVNFTDTSTGDPTEWLWDFGDDSRSRAQSPPHAFATPGSYVVTLTASNPGGSDSSTQTILVSDPPVAQFTFSTDGLRATFTDTSTNSPDQWVWSFGDGTTSTAQSPTKEYEDPGTYTVSLIAGNASGSSSPTVRTVSVAKRPVAAFAAATTGLTASFIDETLNDPTQWFWDLGDGTTSSVQSPTHTYEDAGTYEVTLTAANAAGESSTEDNITVQFAPPVAAFTCESVGASLVCDGTASTGAVEWSWTSSGKPVSESGVDTDRATFTYAKSGNKDVRLRVTNPAGDRDSLRQDYDVVVPEPPEITDIQVLANQGGLVQLLATAVNVPTSWSWTADDAINISGETTASPTFTFDEGGNTAVFVTAANDVGTSERVRFVVDVNLLLPPVVTDVSELSNSGGIVRFRGTATNNPDRWFWNPLDGGTLTSGAGTSQPTFTFTANGSYRINVRAENDDGRSDVFQYTVAVAGVPSPPIITSVNVISNSNGVVELEGIASNNPTTWQWTIPNGAVNGGANSSSPTFIFTANGTYPGTVVASNGDGPSSPVDFTIVIDDLIPAPQAAFEAVSAGNRAGRFRLVNNSVAQPGATYEWTGIDDDWIVQAGDSPVVQFPAPDDYTVRLTVTDAGGTDSDTNTITSD